MEKEFDKLLNKWRDREIGAFWAVIYMFMVEILTGFDLEWRGICLTLFFGGLFLYCRYHVNTIERFIDEIDQ